MLATLTQAAQWCGGIRWGNGDPILTGVRIDSRQVRNGDLFVALPGARTNGHDFINAATDQGAAAVMVSLPFNAAHKISVGQLAVCDGAAALARLASRWRDKFDGTIIAVTGSNGKTTVKEMLASICRDAADESSTHRTIGNFNNRLGVSLTLLELRATHRYAVLETGMDAPGELTELGQMVRPQVAIINNCQRAHIGNFSSLDDIAAAKGELITTLPVDGVAVLNAADPYLNMWQQLAGTRQVLTFGFPGEGADFCGDWDGKHLQLPNGTQVMLRVPGMHNARNALAAAAAAQVLKLPETAVCTGLESFTGVAGRLRFIHRRQLLIIDDSYNANPDSALAAMAVLSDCDGEKIAVLGDMLALGKAADAAHRQIIDAAQQANATVFAVGEHMQAATGSGFSSKAALLKALNARLDAAEGQIVVLVKGSRGMKMEDIVSTLEQRS